MCARHTIHVSGVDRYQSILDIEDILISDESSAHLLLLVLTISKLYCQIDIVDWMIEFKILNTPPVPAAKLTIVHLTRIKRSNWLIASSAQKDHFPWQFSQTKLSQNKEVARLKTRVFQIRSLYRASYSSWVTRLLNFCSVKATTTLAWRAHQLPHRRRTRLGRCRERRQIQSVRRLSSRRRKKGINLFAAAKLMVLFFIGGSPLCIMRPLI